MKIIKKDGRVVDYREEKILMDLDSSERVFNIKFGGDKNKIAREVTNKVKNEPTSITTSELNKHVEEALSEYPAVLSAFREYKSIQQEELDKALNVEHQIKLLEERDKSIINENGNKDSRLFGTQRELLSGSVSKAKGLGMLPEKVRRAHIKGQIHVHDLTNSPYVRQPNCCLVDFVYMFNNGFKLGNAWISPPQNLATASTLIPQVIGEISASQYGGISVHEIDKLLKPYAEKTLIKIKEDFEGLGLSEEVIGERARKILVKEIYDSAQTMEYQINTMATSSAQVPFSTFSLGLGDSWIEKEIQKAILKVRLDGLSDGSTAIFPKILYFVEEGHNLKPEDSFYDVKKLAMETSSKRTYPDMISMKMMEELKPHTNSEYVAQNPNEKLEPITAMGCRSFLHRYYEKNEVGMWEEQVAGRSNAGVISVNLPRIGIEARGDKEYYFDLLEERLLLLKEGLMNREERVLGADKEEAPILYKYGALGPERETVADYYNNKRATISIGYVGLHESMVALFGEEKWHQDKEIYDFSVSVLEYIQGFIDRNQDDFECLLSLYATPAESLATRFSLIDKAKYGEIKHVTDKGYYENSFHYPSYLEINPFDKISSEKDYPAFSSGGYMHYIELPNLLGVTGGTQVGKVYDKVWDMMYENIMYGGVNMPNDTCFECGFEGEMSHLETGYTCPSCGNNEPDKLSVVRRLCGYLGSVSRPVVDGKQKEIDSRIDHM